MPISNTPISATQNNPFQNLAASVTNPSVGGGLNFQGISTNPVTGLNANNASGQDVLNVLSQNTPQSLTAIMGPLIQQLLSTQGGALSSAYQQQAATGMSQAISDAQRRGLTGSSIEESGIQQALAGAGQGYQQAYANLLGNVTGQFGQYAGQDIQGQQQYYQNIAQALGQIVASNIQQSEFQQQLNAGMSQASQLANSQMMSGIFGGLGSAGGGLAQGIGAAGGASAFFSDLRLKDGIKKIGKWMGMNVYAFIYKHDNDMDLPWGTQIGLMAHEVHDKHPECVGIKDGYLTINYGKLKEIYA